MDDQRRRHHLYRVSSPLLTCAAPRTVSLRDLLARRGGPPGFQSSTAITAPGILELSYRDRLRLAVTFASTALQLCSTPWLNETWGKEDIFFLEGTEEPITKNSYVLKSFSSSNSTPQPDGSAVTSGALRPPVSIRNRALFALGVVLIELAFGKSLDDMRDPADLEEGGSMLVDWVTANRLSNIISSNDSGRYADAVSRCVRCEFNHRNPNLDDESFRKVVYHNVVAPLEESWYDFCK